MKTQMMMVSPEMAQTFLEGNIDNRRLRPTWIKQLAGMMTRNEFRLTHQAIAFSSSRRLLDGQHRLIAIIESGKTVPLMVTTDAPEDSFCALDTGSRRTFSDMYKVSIDAAAISNWLGILMHSKPSPVQQSRILAVIETTANELLAFCSAKKKCVTNAQVMSAAIIRILNGEDADYIKLVYWNLAHSSISELPMIGRSFIDQIYASMGTTKRRDPYDSFARALKVFDQSNSGMRRLMITSHVDATDFAREVLSRYLSDEKRPAKPQAQTRAKSLKVSQIKAA